MPFIGKVGDTIFLDDTGDGHPYVILTKPNKDGNVAIVNFTGSKHFGWIVTFRPKDNPKLFTKKCSPNYLDARLYPLSALLKIAKKPHVKTAFCWENHVKQIIIGALQSQHISMEILSELAAQYPNEAAKYYRN